MGRQQPNKYVFSKLRSKKNRRHGRGKLMSYRLPFRISFRKSTTSTRKKEVPPQSTIGVLPPSSLKKGKTHIKKKWCFIQKVKPGKIYAIQIKKSYLQKDIFLLLNIYNI